MRFITYCDYCIGKHICKSRIDDEVLTYDFPNINIFGNCKNYHTATNYTRGISNNYCNTEFNHCDTCDFGSKCKYYKNPEMLNTIKALQIYCKINGYEGLLFTCDSYRPKPTPIIEKPKKKRFSLRFKKGQK